MMNRTSFLVAITALPATAVAGCTAPVQELCTHELSEGTIAVSANADRSSAIALDGSRRCANSQYIFYNRESGIKEVRFWLDVDKRNGRHTAHRIDGSAPYDLVGHASGGSALPLDKLSVGSHKVLVTVQYSDGTFAFSQADFEVIECIGDDEGSFAPVDDGVLAVSARANRANAEQLQGSTHCPGALYIFHPSEDAIDSVKFWLDAASRSERSPDAIERFRPFDLMGTASDGSAGPLEGLSAGRHHVLATVLHDDGSRRDTDAEFEIVSCGTGPEPDPEPEPDLEPVPEPKPGPAGYRTLLDLDFESHGTGLYTESMARSDWGSGLSGFRHMKGEARIVSQNGNKVLDTLQVKGTYGEAPGWHVKLGEEYEEAIFEYRIKFGNGFDFGKKGGKVPGLAAVSSSSCTDRDGTNGFMARLMWKFSRENDRSAGGQLTSYLYHPDKTASCGDSQRFPSSLTDNRWYRIRMHVKMNTPGRRNGEFSVHVDDKEAFHRSNLNWRVNKSGKPAFGISRVLFHTYFGGAKQVWAHDRDEHMYYDDIRLLVGSRTPN